MSCVWRLGVAGARRLRGELVQALGDKPIRGPSERIRLAELTLDSDTTPAVDLLVAAADDAIALTNVTLGERLARAAVDRGGGLAAGELLARSLMWQGKAADAESTLSVFDPDTMDEAKLVGWGAVRIINLQLSMGDAKAAHEVLELLRWRVNTHGPRLVVDGLESASLVFAGPLEEAVEISRRVLSDPAAPPTALGWAVFGGGLALGLMGRGDEVAAVVERGSGIENQVDGVLRHLMAYAEVRALVLLGEFDAAEKRCADSVQISSPSQYLRWGLTNMLAGTVDLARGQFAAAASRMEQTVAALTTESAAWWSYPRLLLAQAYCGLGRAEAAAAIIAELRSRTGGHYAWLHPQLRIVEAWLAAAQGNVSGAIAVATDAADLADQAGQLAVEMLALHDAARFGDRTSLQRLIDVAGSVDGRLARVHAAYGEALLDRDAVAVSAAGEQFEQIGALLSAADAAAQAAEMFRTRDDRRQATEAAASGRPHCQRGDEVAAVVERGSGIENQVDGVLRHLMAYAEVRALVLLGEFDAAEKRCADSVQISSPSQYLRWGLTNMLAGTVDVARGRFAAAASRMEQTVAALTTESAAWWSYPRLLLAQA